MKRASLAALLAMVSLGAGCSLTIDPEGVKPPEEKQQPPATRGACVSSAGGHRLCGGNVSAGASPRMAATGGHVALRSEVGPAAAPAVSNTSHRIVQGAVSP